MFVEWADEEQIFFFFSWWMFCWIVIHFSRWMMTVQHLKWCLECGAICFFFLLISTSIFDVCNGATYCCNPPFYPYEYANPYQQKIFNIWYVIKVQLNWSITSTVFKVWYLEALNKLVCIKALFFFFFLHTTATGVFFKQL